LAPLRKTTRAAPPVYPVVDITLSPAPALVDLVSDSDDHEDLQIKPLLPVGTTLSAPVPLGDLALLVQVKRGESELVIPPTVALQLHDDGEADEFAALLRSPATSLAGSPAAVATSPPSTPAPGPSGLPAFPPSTSFPFQTGYSDDETDLVLDEYEAGDSDLEENARTRGLRMIRRHQLLIWGHVKHLLHHGIHGPWLGHWVKYRGVAEYMLSSALRQIAYLSGCRICGDKDHEFKDCPVGLLRCAQYSSVRAWDEVMCVYPLCALPEYHLVAVCPFLHALCTRCNKRGHRVETCLTINSLPGLEEIYEQSRPLGKAVRARGDEWSFHGPRAMVVNGAPLPSLSYEAGEIVGDLDGAPLLRRRKRRGGVKARAARVKSNLLSYEGVLSSGKLQTKSVRRTERVNKIKNM
jgi:hypothetical protein